MGKNIFKLLLILTIACPLASIGQTNDYSNRKCFGYQKDSCPISKNIYYRVTEDSRSALFAKGQTSRIRLSIYNGRDYRISFCYDPVFGQGVVMRLIDAENGNVLYDNTDDNFATEFEFTVTQSREIYVEISFPGTSDYATSVGNEDLIFVRKDTQIGCVGILVEHMITPPKGF